MADSIVQGVEFFLLYILESMCKSSFWFWAIVTWQGNSHPWAVHTERERGLGARDWSLNFSKTLGALWKASFICTKIASIIITTSSCCIGAKYWSPQYCIYFTGLLEGWERMGHLGC